MAITCGIDNGTQSTKVLIYDSEKKVVLAQGQASHELISRKDGSREQDASSWIAALKDCFNQIALSIRESIEAIGVSGQQHGFVPLDKEGNVLSLVKLWCDTSTQKECDEINSALGGEDKAIKIAGNAIKVGYTASKVLAFKKYQRDKYARLAKILLPHDYLNYVLTGEYTTECGDASGTGYFDLKNKSWSQEVLSAIDKDQDWDSVLPRLVKSNESAGTVTKEASLLFGIKEGIPVSCGGGDNMMGAIGTGTVTEGALTMSIGTSGTLYAYSDVPVIDEAGSLAAFCSSSGGYLPLLCTMNCTVSSEVTRSLWDMDVKSFDKLASTSPIGADGVIMLPFFNGERSPNYPKGKGTLFGLDLNNFNKANIARSAMEASIYGLMYGLDSFKALGFVPKSVTLIGGGAKSALWRQMVSDITGLEVKLPLQKEAAAFGGALQALALLSDKSLSELTKEHILFDSSLSTYPNKESFEEYKKSYKAWLEKVNFVSSIYS